MTEQEFSDRLDRLIDAFEQSIGRMGGSVNRTSGVVGSLASSLTSASKAGSYTQQVFEQMAGSGMSAATADKLKVRSGEAVVETFKTLIDSSRRATESMYGASSGFATFSRTLNDVELVAGKVKNVLQVSLLSTMNPAAIAFAAAIEPISDGLKIMSDSVGTLLNLMERQVTDYQRVNQVGAIFGGTLANMQLAAQQAGVSIPMLTKIILETADDLKMLGAGLSRNSTIVANFASGIARSDKALLNLYGSTEELARGTAAYLALQAQLGDREIGSLDKQREGLNAFLLRQKELTEITGKRGEQLKNEEAARRRELAYNLKLQRLSDTARQNVAEGVAIAGQIGGDAGAKYAQEFFATGGKVVSRESLAFAATMPEASRAIEAMVANVNQSKEDYRKSIGGYIEANKEGMLAEAKSNEYLAELAYSDALPQIARNMTTFSGTLVNAETYLQNFNSLLQAMAEDEKLRRAGKVMVPGAREGEPGRIIEDKVAATIMAAEQERLTVQKAIDAMVNDNFGKMQGVITALGAAQLVQVKITDGLVSTAATIADGITTLAKAITKGTTGDIQSAEDALRNLTRKRKDENTNTPVPPVDNMATGGVATRPTMVAEDGSPEAVIPLAKGAVPLNIDWRPLLDVMQQQVAQNNDIIRALNDSASTQEKMLYSMG